MIRFLLLLLLLPTPLYATPVEAVLSDTNIKMDADFTGKELFLVGARNDSGDIIVVVRGPEESYQIRKKERIAYMWLNRDRMKLFDVPSFYAVASTKEL